MRRIIGFAFFLIINGNCYAQDVNSKWKANLIYSFGIPSGAFGAVDTAKSVSYVLQNAPQLNGPDKKGHAAAVQGVGIEFTLTRSLIKKLLCWPRRLNDILTCTGGSHGWSSTT